jgi:hypothetical protein
VGRPVVGPRATGVAASRARLESARAYQEAGDREGARRMLGNVASDTTAGAASASAAATLINVLVDDGRIEEAEARLATARPGVPTDEFQALNRRVATGWVRRGDLDRAERVIQSDSTVEGMALSGRIAIFRGDLAGGVRRPQLAGPHPGPRAGRAPAPLRPRAPHATTSASRRLPPRMPWRPCWRRPASAFAWSTDVERALFL